MDYYYEYFYRLRRFFRFHPKEFYELLVSIAVIAFIWGFDDGQPVFSLTHWLSNYLEVFLIVSISFFVHVSAQKLLGLWHGYRIEYHFWTTGLLIGVIVALLTKGALPLLLPGGILFYHMSKQRIGEFRYGLNFFQCGIAATAGPVGNVLFAMFAKTMQWIFFPQSPFLDQLYWFNLVFAMFMMLPLPNLPGIAMFFGSRLTYVLFFGMIFSYVLLVALFGFYSLIFAVIFGFIIYGLFVWYVEYGK
ncbi:MAG: hypothetical protein QW594_01870 [Candidatus Woesearchaeota archaeon]